MHCSWWRSVACPQNEPLGHGSGQRESRCLSLLHSRYSLCSFVFTLLVQWFTPLPSLPWVHARLSFSLSPLLSSCKPLQPLMACIRKSRTLVLCLAHLEVRRRRQSRYNTRSSVGYTCTSATKNRFTLLDFVCLCVTGFFTGLSLSLSFSYQLTLMIGYKDKSGPIFAVFHRIIRVKFRNWTASSCCTC